jgi:hypothetical protein
MFISVVILLQVATDLLVDGTISVDGSHGGSDSGGGSGGTIYIEYVFLNLSHLNFCQRLTFIQH